MFFLKYLLLLKIKEISIIILFPYFIIRKILIIFKFKRYFRSFNNRTNTNLAFNLLYQQFHSTILPTILRNFDKISMQHGIEIRMPFMDYRLVSYLFSLSETSKYKNLAKQYLPNGQSGLVTFGVDGGYESAKIIYC